MSLIYNAMCPILCLKARLFNILIVICKISLALVNIKAIKKNIKSNIKEISLTQ